MSEIKFKRDTSFRKQFFVPDSFAHPAKMDAQLLIWIVEHYTKPGEIILDPMAGSGTTMLACTLGRNVFLIELEEKFVKMCRDNWAEVRMRPQLGYDMGICDIKQGDARNLEHILFDKIISSPPWAEVGTDIPVTGRHHQVVRKDSTHTLEYVDKIVTSPPYAKAVELRQSGKMKSSTKGTNAKGQLKNYLDSCAKQESGRIENPDNIGNLKYGSIEDIK